MLEARMGFFSISGSVEGGPEEKGDRCFRKGMRILRAAVGGVCNKNGRCSLPLFVSRKTVKRGTCAQ